MAMAETLAETLAIVALPLAMDPSAEGPAAFGAAAVLTGAAAVYAVLREGDRRGAQQRLHRVSEKRKFAVKLRLQLAVLFALAGLAVWGHVSSMLAGFSLGLAVADVGEPRWLARQLFAITEGFLGPCSLSGSVPPCSCRHWVNIRGRSFLDLFWVWTLWPCVPPYGCWGRNSLWGCWRPCRWGSRCTRPPSAYSRVCWNLEKRRPSSSAPW
ncbi:hypothetical protein AS189_13180 [Arthrobacter alpinus]|uniref:Uncharacterized protein n=1 Tax=Arthrobacter alpinus TaxID=656366 RepID=A0A0S2M0Q9_9MICC|nr:hypothetical protein AS189_13180 [Arthrobacter alpinus]